MTIEEILQSLRDCDYAECKEWADAIEAAMREPVAYQDTWDTGLFSLPGDVREADRSGMVPLFRLPPDAAGEIERLKAQVDALMLEFCPDEMTHEQVARWGENQKPALAGKEANHE